MSQKAFVAGDVIIFRLPTNAIVDLHTLALSWDLAVTNSNSAAGGVEVILPRYSQSFVRRIDVTAGGVQVGLGSLNDYGGLWSLLATNGISTTKTGELAVLEGGSATVAEASSEIIAASTYGSNSTTWTNSNGTKWECPGLFSTVLPLSSTSYWRQNITGFLGVLGGQYMRFLDTNLLPDVEIRITLAPAAVIAGSVNSTNAASSSTISYTINTPYAQMETISFGDNTYEQMVEARLSTGEPIVVPFINHASFETSTGGGSGAQSSTATTQFTVATQSLNTVIGSARAYNYDTFQAAVNPATSVQVPFYSFDAQCIKGHMLPTSQQNAGAYALGDSRIAPARYQTTIDSKVYPQFMADVGDAYQISKNAYDGAGNNKLYGGIVRDLYSWAHSAFMLAISLDHNSEDTMKDRLVSGLNTNGSNIPVTWQLSSVDGPDGYRPVVFVEMTSTLMIYPGRVISVIN